MSERNHYPHGVPCWVDTLQPDVQSALAFYGSLFDWSFAGPGPMANNPSGSYYVAQVKNRDVAGVGSLPPHAGWQASWNTYVRVDDVDAVAKLAQEAGGTLLDGPFNVAPAGRIAVLADPSGAVICLWHPKARQGAQLINEHRAWAMSALRTHDGERAKAFYAAVFGWDADPLMGADNVLLWRLPGFFGGEPSQPVPRDVVGVMEIVPESKTLERPHWAVDFWVADAQRTATHAQEMNGKLLAPIEDSPLFKTAVIADPQGAVFSVSQLLMTSP